jgi:hypothetical protein
LPGGNHASFFSISHTESFCDVEASVQLERHYLAVPAFLRHDPGTVPTLNSILRQPFWTGDSQVNLYQQARIPLKPSIQFDMLFF